MGKTKKFRSATGCVICLTKSSSSRFTNSERFAEHFVPCFGQRARDRSGDLCNACVLHVKRHMQRPVVRRQVAGFEKVLDSKKGAGPKHMKQIAKRQRSRDARLATSSAPESHPVDAVVAPVGSGGVATPVSSAAGVSCALAVLSSTVVSRVDTRSKTHSLQQHTPSSSSSVVSLDTTGNRSNSTDPEVLASPSPSTRSSYVSRSSVAASGTTSVEPDADCVHFRVPVGKNRYRRNYTPPVKMCNDQDNDDLMRAILAKNSSAVNLDAREMHTYLYKQRLRNHNNGMSLTASSETFSHADYQSVGSASFCSGDLTGARN